MRTLLEYVFLAAWLSKLYCIHKQMYSVSFKTVDFQGNSSGPARLFGGVMAASETMGMWRLYAKNRNGGGGVGGWGGGG